ncbi:MAG: hypothetical protein KKH02_04870 [Proteobacteria bacterium]|nr:hypothetical protein [Pseudomonadota bacterium]MBU4581735.1 hypothetical protein [Pseudomonadota bacterium]MCG2739490.1 hypothetical protein [Syntrophaceae bacterium]
MSGKQRFDDWPERYDRWFETPVGKAVLKYEAELILELLRPGRGERILDAGSGTGLFTRVFFRSPAELLAATSVSGIVRTAVHFGKEDDPATFDRSEREGEGRETGAFVAARWLKP